MMKIKFIFLVTLFSFSLQDNHCLHSQKSCNYYAYPLVPNCKLGAFNQCRQCEENFSLSNDRTKCINVPHCDYFNEEEKCTQCESYYNFDSNGNCVKDYCQLYYDDDNTKCYICYLGFYLDKEYKCQKIDIPYCLQVEGDTCISCAYGTDLVDGQCIVSDNYNQIEGCNTYNEDKTACSRCEENYELSNGKCTFKNQCQGYPVYELCLSCEDGYYLYTQLYQCRAYDGTVENTSSNDNDNKSGNKAENNDNKSDNKTENNDNKSDNKSERIFINFALVFLLLGLI